MRKLSLFLISFIFICSSTELHQLIQLPFLVQHYRHHKTENPGMSLFAFLRDHYQGEKDNGEDNRDDTKLPLCSTDPILHLGQFEAFSHHWEIQKPAHSFQAYTALTDPSLSAGLAVTIFQPPRVA